MEGGRGSGRVTASVLYTSGGNNVCGPHMKELFNNEKHVAFCPLEEP